MKTTKRILSLFLSILLVTMLLSAATTNAAVAATKIKLNTSVLTITSGNKYKLKATITPSNTTNKTVYWKSSNTKVVSMGAGGVVNAKNAGTATVTAKTSNGKSATCKVTVKRKGSATTSISVSPKTLTISVGNKYKLKATIAPSNASNKTVYWSSSNTSVASMGSGGVLTAKRAGSATITAKTSNGKTATCKVTVITKGDSWSAANNYSLGTKVSSYLSETKNVVYYKFTLSSSGRINLRATAKMNYIYYYIYDASHSSLEYWHPYWDSTTKISSKNETLDLVAGTYYFVVARDGYNGQYDFTISFSSANESFSESQNTQYNSYSSARGISMGSRYYGQIAKNDDVDYYKFSLSSSGRVSLSARSHIHYVYYSIYDANYNRLVRWHPCWDSTTEVSSISETIDLTSGTYYLVVARDGYTGNYDFSLSFSSANESFSESQGTQYNNYNSARSISFNTQYNGQLATNDSVDYYKFTLSSSRSVKLIANSYMFKLKYYIYDKDFNRVNWWRIYWNDSTKVGTLNETINLSPGTYYFVVAEEDGYTGNYSFRFS